MRMRILAAAAAFCLQLLYLSSSCYGEADKTAVEVVGFGECADCQKTNVDPSKAFQGLRVTINCKTASGEVKRRGAGALDEMGKFTVALRPEMVVGGKLMEDCYAQLVGASAEPCPAASSIASSKVVFKSMGQGGKHTFGLAGKLMFSPSTCTSAFLWPYFKPLPPIPIYKKPCPPLPPIIYKPLPPIPIYKKPFPPIIYKPLPPIPIYKKPFPPIIYKPLPPIPIYKKPFPPIIYKPLPPIPIYTKPFPPIIYKPLPPFPIYKHPLPPITKPPCPPLPKIPPFPSHP
ncbi:hypothetical protein SAY87_020869 [Trapa incisa]|uniref:Uncharacterized protein n=1 Tax=Trapa incisa TaxID=236973 RepID=A0AAN7PQ03_9MYRT|nr:hypothetical protein SAY87_020869 [Trapa incisa]